MAYKAYSLWLMAITHLYLVTKYLTKKICMHIFPLMFFFFHFLAWVRLSYFLNQIWKLEWNGQSKRITSISKTEARKNIINKCIYLKKKKDSVVKCRPQLHPLHHLHHHHPAQVEYLVELGKPCLILYHFHFIVNCRVYAHRFSYKKVNFVIIYSSVIASSP